MGKTNDSETGKRRTLKYNELRGLAWRARAIGALLMEMHSDSRLDETVLWGIGDAVWDIGHSIEAILLGFGLQSYPNVEQKNTGRRKHGR